MRRLFKWLVFLVVVVSGGWLGLRAYLGSAAAAAQLAASISAEFSNTRVTVGGLDVGLAGCAATDIAIYELDAGTDDPPFATIARADTDLTIGDILQGQTAPRQLTLTRLHILVRHDYDGKLLTRVPHPSGPDKPFPKVRLVNGELTIKKLGEPNARFAGLDAAVSEAAGNVNLVGIINDPAWGGAWDVEGAMPKIGGTATLHLKSAGMHVTQAMLRRVPYVSDRIWQNVTLEGDTPIDLQVIVPPAPAKPRYRVDLSPVNTSVYVPSIDLKAASAAGRVLVQDGLVQLREVRGRVAEGGLHVLAADLDYRQPITAMKFDLEAAKLILKALPASWRLPPRLGGKLTGTATLMVRIINGIPIMSGAGDGRVDDATLGIIPLPGYGLHIQADRDGFRFEPRLVR